LSTFIEDAKDQDSSGLALILNCHFPYLSLYTPFITAYPTAMTTIIKLQAENVAFAEFIKMKEADPLCRRLGLQAWLLTIVQRCPRYLLMLKVWRKSSQSPDPLK
jgi:FYVE/RhoGEF/PH domain-containing protein 5/6